MKTAVQSILHQEFKDFEYLIVNDGSTDATADLLQDLVDSDRRIRVVTAINQGLTKSLNLAISLSDSKYVARMDADDWSHPLRLATQMNALRDGPSNTGICCTRARIMFSKEVVPKLSTYVFRHHVTPLLNPYVHGTYVISRTALNVVGNYDEHYPVSQDYKLVYDLESFGYSVLCLKRPLYELRIHDESVTRIRSEEQEACAKKVAALFDQRKHRAKTRTLSWLRSLGRGSTLKSGAS